MKTHKLDGGSRKVGAHVSASGGPDKAVERAAEIGANCVQIFSGSPRVWQRPNLSAVNVDKVFAKQEELLVSPIFIHALYLVNLASENPELVRKSTEAIIFDLQYNSLLKGAGVVVHLGSHQGRGWEAVREQVARTISAILEKTPAGSHFLMENAAGQQGKVGGDLAEIKWLLNKVKDERLGWCLDTCHAFASGYSLGSVPKTGAAPITNGKVTRERSLIEEIEALGLHKNLFCIHVNDSRDPFGSGRDRHANLGDGIIKKDDFEYFLNHPLIANQPLILEVPGVKDEGPDAENIARLKKLVGE